MADSLMKGHRVLDPRYGRTGVIIDTEREPDGSLDCLVAWQGERDPRRQLSWIGADQLERRDD